MDDNKRLFRVLVFANFILYFGFNIWQATFTNFAVDELGIRADQIGWLQSIREVPGLMGVLMSLLVLWLSEMRVMGLSVLLLGLGLGITGMADNLSVLILGTVVMSIGFHFFYPSSSSVVLMGVTKAEAPKVLGKLNSVAAFSAVLGTVMVWVFVSGVDMGAVHIPGWGYRTLLYVTGAVVIIGGLFSLFNSHRLGEQKQQRRAIIFRRQYWLYYALTFLMGSRRHIFSTFAIFLLVQVYKINIQQTAALLLVNNLINVYASAQLGRMVARFGERKVLIVNFIGLIGVFLGYAYIPSLPILYVLFVLDNVFMGFSFAVDSYFQKIAVSPDEITSNVSLSQTINHMSALVVPVLGGILWEQIAPSATFLAGVVIVAIALVLVLFMQTPEFAPRVTAPAAE